MKLTIFLVLLTIALASGRLLDESFKEKPYELDDSAFLQEENYIKSQLPHLNSKNKRFLSVLDIFKPKNNEEGSSKGKDLIDQFDKFLCKYTNNCIGDIIKPNKPGSFSTAHPNSAVESDPFYKLKVQCDRNYDDFCRNKKREMRELVKKCETYDARAQPESCKELISVYCYVYLTHDIFRCFSNDYQAYKPGVKKFTTAPATTYSTRQPVITTYSTKQYSVVTTTKPTTTRLTTTSRTVVTSSGSSSVNPFGNEPFTTIPNDADKLKKIGQYCQTIKTKEPNCDKALLMLRENFKRCEKSPKTDHECQSFKMNLCGAFPKFACCSDILAGRNCAGSKTRRSVLLYM